MIKHIAIMVAGRAHCFHDYIYTYIIIIIINIIIFIIIIIIIIIIVIIIITTIYIYNAWKSWSSSNSIMLELYSLQLYWKLTPTPAFFQDKMQLSILVLYIC